MVHFGKILAFCLFLPTVLFSQQDILQFSLEDLSGITLEKSVATLTKTDQKDIPASVTVITAHDIQQSGARNLDELLEIYVPSFAYMYKTEGYQMGIRGIISDRNNKILLLVNNKVMNIKASDGGAVTERWFSMLGDIKKITVIRGPGSVIYGAGAIAGVISIETFSFKEKEGLELSVQDGYNEDFVNFQASYGKKFDNNWGLYLYYGLDRYNGGDNTNAPEKFSFDINRTERWKGQWPYMEADTPYPYRSCGDNGSFENGLRHKVHLQLQKGGFCFGHALQEVHLPYRVISLTM